MISKAFWRGGTMVLTITTNQTNLNLRTYANAHGYTGGRISILTATGLVFGSASTGSPAVDSGTWPTGIVPQFTLAAGSFIEGAGGGGGNGGNNAGAPGTGGNAGGTAFNASAPIIVNNLSSILGGGGGGSGGGITNITIGCSPSVIPGGGGGGGQGNAGGAAGAGAVGTGAPITPSGNGTAGTPSGPGTGGTAGFYQPPCCGPRTTGVVGANGGAWGTAGGSSTFAGGAAGHSVTGNSNITWVNTGTRTGPIS